MNLSWFATFTLPCTQSLQHCLKNTPDNSPRPLICLLEKKRFSEGMKGGQQFYGISRGVGGSNMKFPS